MPDLAGAKGCCVLKPYSSRGGRSNTALKTKRKRMQAGLDCMRFSDGCDACIAANHRREAEKGFGDEIPKRVLAAAQRVHCMERRGDEDYARQID